ncbi:MAG: TauD/TfdA family dioxygenase [Hormoscilla sp. SP5CHS1]|nr:TauD/TfdA family dioxygenase [Hormoscilla sp. SP12CHS1]MBC6455540.1 TauD/TfdA family dioxygenase [Hormoscilla sp. SP5CHS1]
MITLVQQVKLAFQINSVAKTEKGVVIIWKDSHETFFDNLWLRDSCRCSECFQHDTLGKNIDLLQIPLAPKIDRVSITQEGNLDIIWGGEEQGHHSVYDASWLRAHCSKVLAQKPRPQLWDGSFEVPQFDYSEVLNDDEVLFKWLNKLYKTGATIINETPKTEEGLKSLAQRIGMIRPRYHPTNVFKLDTTDEALHKINPSYKSDRLYLHADYAAYDNAATLIFFHCVEYENPDKDEQAYSIIADGLKIAELLKEQKPEYFNLLSQEYVSFYRRRFSVQEEILENDSIYNYQWEGYHLGHIINLDTQGEVRLLRFRSKLRAPFLLDPDKRQQFYEAYRYFMTLIEQPEYICRFLMAPGQVLVFNNRRILHGRTGYSNSLRRVVNGVAVDEEAFRSRWRILLGRKTGMSDVWLAGCSDYSLEILADRMMF